MKKIVLIFSVISLMISCKKECTYVDNTCIEEKVELNTPYSSLLVGKWKYVHSGTFLSQNNYARIPSYQADYEIEFKENGDFLEKNNDESMLTAFYTGTYNQGGGGQNLQGSSHWKARVHFFQECEYSKHYEIHYFLGDSIAIIHAPFDFSESNWMGNPPIPKVNFFRRM